MATIEDDLLVSAQEQYATYLELARLTEIVHVDRGSRVDPDAGELPTFFAPAVAPMTLSVR